MYKFILVILSVLTLSACCETPAGRCIELTDGSGKMAIYVKYTGNSYIARLYKSKKLIKLKSAGDFIFVKDSKCGNKNQYG